MNWIFIAVISGSIVTSGHETKEQCLGRKALLSEQKIEGKCVEAPSRTSGLIYYGTLPVTNGNNNILVGPDSGK